MGKKKRTKGVEAIESVISSTQMDIDKYSEEIAKLEKQTSTIDNLRQIKLDELDSLNKDLKKLEKK